jgi:type I restriction enzyme R subunit
MLETLKEEKLVLDWRKRQQSRAAVRVLIEDMDWDLPQSYTDDQCEQKSQAIYQHVYDKYWGAWSAGQSVYAGG